MNRIALFIDGNVRMSEFGDIIQRLNDAGFLIYGHYMDFQENGVYIETWYEDIEDVKGTIDCIPNVRIDYGTMEEWNGQQEEID